MSGCARNTANNTVTQSANGTAIGHSITISTPATGQTVLLSAAASTNGPPLSYQWYVGGTNIGSTINSTAASQTSTNLTPAAGQNTIFSVVATNGPALSYQWYVNGTNIAGTTNR